MSKEDKPVSKSSKKGVSPSDTGQLARTAVNKLRNVIKAKVRREAEAKKRLAVFHGQARAIRRDAARPARQAQEGKSRPLSAFC